MPSRSKVGSWLEGSGSAAASEAYESESDKAGSSSSASEHDRDRVISGGKAHTATEITDDASDEQEIRDEEVDWGMTIPKIRFAVMDRSKKRRAAFISRYLSGADSCAFPCFCGYGC